MKINILYIVLFTFSSFSLFNCTDSPEGSKAHQEAVLKNSQIENLLKIAIEQKDEMEEKSNEMLEKINQDSISSENQTKEILNFNQSISIAEGTIKNLKTMLAQHKEYLDKHENTALGVDQIKAQHAQINKDFLLAQKEATALNKLYDNLLLQYKKLVSQN